MLVAGSEPHLLAAIDGAGGGTHAADQDQPRPGDDRAGPGVAGTPGSLPRTPVPWALQPAGGRVLVVDPCADTLLSTSWLLRLWGYDVRSAATGPVALAAARAYRPDVILMEPRLPGLDGWQVARQLR